MSRLVVYFLLFVSPLLSIALVLLGMFTLPSNLMGWFLLFMGIMYSVGIFTTAFIRKKQFWTGVSGNTVIEEERNDRSFWLIALGLIAVFFLSPLDYLYFPSVFSGLIELEVVGLGLVLSGISLFVWARMALGKDYSGHVSIGDEQTLVQSGPYRYIRHPAYTGYLLMALGICLGYASLTGLIALIAFLIPVVYYRSRLEDQMLASHFGEQWQAYARRVPAFIPAFRKGEQR